MQSNDNIILNIYWGFINILRTLLISLKRNIGLLIGCVVVVAALLLLNQMRNEGKYKASFTVTYDDLVRKIYGDRLYKLNLLVDRGQYGRVSKLLGLTEQEAKALLQIRGKNILGENLTEDLNTDKIPFIVEILVTDTAAIPGIQAGIVGFLETGNAYLATTKKMKVQEIEDELKFIDQQLGMMDSLKKKYNATQLAGDNTDKNSSSLSTIYNFSYDLYKRKQELQRKKAMPDTIQVLDDAIAVKKSSLTLVSLIIVSLIGGFCLFLFILIFIKPVFKKAA